MNNIMTKDFIKKTLEELKEFTAEGKFLLKAEFCNHAKHLPGSKCVWCGAILPKQSDEH